MIFSSWLHQIKTYFTKVIFTPVFTSYQKSGTDKDAKQIDEHDSTLREKCKYAAQDVRYIKNLTYWPIAKTKDMPEDGSLVYLNVNQVKRESIKTKADGTRKNVTLIHSNKQTETTTLKKKL